jgi:hypothetical protein
VLSNKQSSINQKIEAVIKEDEELSKLFSV